MSNYLVLDIENNSSKLYGRKAGNFSIDKIVALGLASKEFSQSYYFKEIEGKNIDFKDILADKGYVFRYFDLIVGHNLTHDLLFLSDNPEIVKFLKHGSRIWDTQLAHYILSGQEDQYPALRDIAVNKYNLKEREKKMEVYWENGFQTSNIPEKLVREDVLNDVLDTEQIYLQQLVLAEELGVTALIQESNQALLATIQMEYSGIYIDKSEMFKNKKILEEQLQKANLELSELVKKYWV